MNNKNRTLIFSLLCIFGSYTTANAHYSIPNFECTLTDKGDAVQNPHYGNDAGYFYKNSTSAIYLICESNTVKRTDNIRAVWIYEEPTEYRKIAEKKVVVKQNLNDVDIFKTRFALKNCDYSLPRGNYHVRLYVNGIEGNVYYFKVY